MNFYEIDAFLEQNAYPYYAGRKDEDSEDLQDSMYRALMHSLSLEELSFLVECWEQDVNCPSTLFYKAQGILKFKQRCEMSGISTPTLLKWYADKKSRKVGLSAKELKTRFARETTESRRAILKAFLLSGKKEMEWAARYLLRAPWSRSMAPYVREAWRRTHHPQIAQVVLKHLPYTFVLEEQEGLAEAAGYVYVCARLGTKRSFLFDESRLNAPEYLYAAAKSGRKVDRMTAEAMLDKYLGGEDGMISSWDMGIILWALGRMGLADEIVKLKMMSDEEPGKILWDNQWPS